MIKIHKKSLDGSLEMNESRSHAHDQRRIVGRENLRYMWKRSDL